MSILRVTLKRVSPLLLLSSNLFLGSKSIYNTLSKPIRQGLPLSPLMLIVANIFGNSLSLVVDKKIIKGVPLPKVGEEFTRDKLLITQKSSSKQS